MPKPGAEPTEDYEDDDACESSWPMTDLIPHSTIFRRRAAAIQKPGDLNTTSLPVRLISSRQSLFAFPSNELFGTLVQQFKPDAGSVRGQIWTLVRACEQTATSFTIRP
jgi:hypothetical protein